MKRKDIEIKSFDWDWEMDSYAKEHHMVYAGYGTNSKKEILTGCIKEIEETGIQHYVFYVNEAYYLYADEEIKLLYEINKRDNYISYTLNPEIVRYEESVRKRKEALKEIAELKKELQRILEKKKKKKGGERNVCLDNKN